MRDGEARLHRDQARRLGGVDVLHALHEVEFFRLVAVFADRCHGVLHLGRIDAAEVLFGHALLIGASVDGATLTRYEICVQT